MLFSAPSQSLTKLSPSCFTSKTKVNHSEPRKHSKLTPSLESKINKPFTAPVKDVVPTTG